MRARALRGPEVIRVVRGSAFSAAILLVGALVWSVSGQTSAPTGASFAAGLTAMDYVQIRQLAARAAFAMDTGDGNGYAYADLFVPDGESAIPDARGREQLAALARGGRRGPMYSSLYGANHIIEPAPGGAIGKQYVIAIDHDDEGSFTRNPAQNQWDLVGQKRGALSSFGGHYEDAYVKTASGWRFRRRAFVQSSSGPRRASMPTQLAHASVPAPVAPDTRPLNGLTATDYFEIESLVASYGHALDNAYGREDDGTAYAHLFTADGRFRQVVGHADLAALAREQVRGSNYVRHFLTNIVIEPAPGGAVGKQYVAVLDVPDRSTGQPGTIFLGGHYEDEYVKTPEGWRFKTRTRVGSRAGVQPPR
jgi:hypothetical protein